MSPLPRRACLRPSSDFFRALVVVLAFATFSSFAGALELTVSPTTENFGIVDLGSSSSKTVTVTNTGSSTVKISHVAIWGTGFSVKGITVPYILSARDSTTFELVYTPQTATASSGGFIVISNATDPQVRGTLSGTGWKAVTGSVPSTFMGMALHPEVLNGRVAWPAVSFGAMRLWDTETQWSLLNPALGVYDWTELDSWFAIAAANGKTDLTYTFAVVPQWASSKPNDQTCVSGNSGPGSCDAPYDVNADGTGTDAVWQDFVTAIVAHAAGRVKYWEMWNEPDCPYEWSGTNAQLVRMAKDAYAIIKKADPTSLVTTPTSVDAGSGRSIDTWLPAYLAAGGAPYADIVSFHGYINPSLGQQPEDITGTVDQVTSSITGTALASKPVWNTEGGWTNNTALPDPDLEASFVARVYILQWFKGVSRFYWFQYGNDDTGTLWTSAGMNEAGIAYGQVYDWLVNATLSGPCTATGTVWTCNFTKTGGLQEQVVWDTSKTCSGGRCTTSSYTPATIYSKYIDLAGNVTSFTPGTSIQIGIKPILLEN
jgi:hypothetical protein